MKYFYSISGIVICILAIYVILTLNIVRPVSDKLLSAFKSEKSKYQEYISNDRYSVIIDYTLPVWRERMWLVDNSNDSIILRTHVTQSFKSGLWRVATVSNTIGSNLTSVGSFVTLDSYTGNYGYSMQVRGLEPTNNNVTVRRVVFHPYGEIHILNIDIPLPFYTLGCFSSNVTDLTAIINSTKGGGFVYVHFHEDDNFRFF